MSESGTLGEHSFESGDEDFGWTRTVLQDGVRSEERCAPIERGPVVGRCRCGWASDQSPRDYCPLLLSSSVTHGDREEVARHLWMVDVGSLSSEPDSLGEEEELLRFLIDLRSLVRSDYMEMWSVPVFMDTGLCRDLVDVPIA